MIWHNAKVMRPPHTGVMCIVLDDVEGLTVAQFDFQIEIGYHYVNLDNCQILKHVTHFTMPSPVEIES